MLICAQIVLNCTKMLLNYATLSSNCTARIVLKVKRPQVEKTACECYEGGGSSETRCERRESAGGASGEAKTPHNKS